MNNNYSFCKFKIPNNGARVIWEVTNECNYGCKYCIFSSTGRKPMGELSTEKSFETLLELKKCGFTYIKFTGGEPFLRDDMLDILTYARQLGFDCDISTNASKITPEIAQKLADLQLEYIHVSIDGYDQSSHESVRGKKSFEPTVRGLTLLKQYNNRIRIGTVIHSHNEHNIEDMVDFFNQFNVDKIAFSLMEPVGRLKDKKTLLASDSAMNIAKKIDCVISKFSQYDVAISHNLTTLNTVQFFQPAAIRSSSLPCPGGEKFLFINSIGVVSPCTWVSEHKPSYHQLSLHDESLYDILQSPLFTQFNHVKKIIAQHHGVCPMEALSHFHTIEETVIQSINNTTSYFDKYAPIYSFTTENLSYLQSLRIINKNVLTITGSGDHAIVLAYLGAKEVTNIDINHRANLYTQLKIEAIKSLSFEQFKQFFLINSSSFSYEIYLTFKASLPLPCQYFWDFVYSQFDYNGQAIRQSHLFNLQYDINEDKIKHSFYLKDSHVYYEAQKAVKKTSYRYQTQSITHFVKTHPVNKYDLILLSNIADYCHKMFDTDNYIDIFRDEIVISLMTTHLKKDGFMMFSYLFDALNIFHSDKRNHMNNSLLRNNCYQLKDLSYSNFYVESAIKDAHYDCVCILSYLEV